MGGMRILTQRVGVLPTQESMLSTQEWMLLHRVKKGQVQSTPMGIVLQTLGANSAPHTSPLCVH